MSNYYADPILSDDTSRTAETSLTIDQAISIFGAPNEGPSDKTSASWVLNLEGTIVTLYDWKGNDSLTLGSHHENRDAARAALRIVLNRHGYPYTEISS